MRIRKEKRERGKEWSRMGGIGKKKENKLQLKSGPSEKGMPVFIHLSFSCRSVELENETGFSSWNVKKTRKLRQHCHLEKA